MARTVAPTDYRIRSRKLVAFLLLICLAVCTAVLCSLMLPNPNAREERLKLEMAGHVARADYDAAMESALALQQISPDSLKVAFQRAMIEHARGRLDDAHKIVEELIARGSSEAAMWQLERSAQQPASEWSEQEQTRFEELVVMAATSEDVNTRVRVRQLWAANRLQLGELQAALQTLEELAPEDPISSVHAAAIARQLGLADKSRQWALNAKRYLTTKLEKHPKDDECRLSLVRSLLLLDQESDAVRLLSEGFSLTAQPKFQQAAGEAMIAWANRLKTTSSASLSASARLQLVHRATQCAPSDPVVLSGVTELMLEFSQRGEQAQSMLRHQIARGHDPESGHFMLGLLSLLSSDNADAKLHFDLAEKAGSHLATLLNNLALNTLTDQRLPHEQALLLVNEAIRRIPHEPRFRETHSLILGQLSK